MEGGRVYQPVLPVAARVRQDGRIELRSPGVGLWRSGPRLGSVVVPGDALGALEVLGVLHVLRSPADARGLVVERCGLGGSARVAVGYGEPLLVLDPEAAGEVAAEPAGAGAQSSKGAGAVVFRAPSSGRFYRRPAPGKPPFVEVGDEIAAGQTVCLLEVMKTFNRIAYQPDPGSGLPDRARIAAVLPADGDDLESSAPILELEEIP